MDISGLTGSTGALVRLALDGVSLRQLATANNIANASTPGYAPLRVDFESQLEAALRAAGSARGAQSPAITTDAAPGAKVQLDMEAAQMAQDVLHYQALLRALRGQMDLLQAAINEGRR
jgi:flagellar basal-body rod protein FlgB